MAQQMTQMRLKGADRLKVLWCAGIAVSHSGETGQRSRDAISHLDGLAEPG